jgi:methyl-accepting chemotaxis protein
VDLSTDESETAPGERVTEVREQVTAARRRVAALLPSFVRQNLTAKLLLMLFLGVLVSGVAVFFLYGSIDAGLNEQVTAQVESDTSLHAQWYDEWLEEQWSTLNSQSASPEMLSDSPDEINPWLVTFLPDMDEEITLLHVVDGETGEIIGSSRSSTVGTNIYEAGVSDETTDNQMFITHPTSSGGEQITYVGVQGPGNRLLVAGVQSNTSVVSTQAFGGAETTLRTLDGQRLLGPSEKETLDFITDRDIDVGTVQVGRQDTVVAGTQTLAHSRRSGISQDEYAEDGMIGTVVVTSVPESEAFALQQEISSDILFAFGLSFVLLIGTALVAMRSVTGAIDDISGRTQEISDGDFDVELQTAREDELGSLYDSVDEMRNSLQTRLEEANRREDELESAKEEAEGAKEDAERAKKEAEAARQQAEMFSQRLEERAEEYSNQLAAFADGDLTVRLDTDTRSDALGQIAHSFNDMADTLEETIRHIREFAADVNVSSDEISASTQEVKQTSDDVSRSMQEIADDAERQNEAIHQASDQVTEQSASIEEVAASTQQAAAKSQQAAQLCAEGQEYADETTEEMNAIDRQTEAVVEEIDRLDSEVGAIGDIVELIEDIAEQVNMLALNASIEAARAGEAGSGFAVVADEIKQLAEETQDATDEIEELVDRTQSSTDDVVVDIQEMRESVSTGIETVTQTVDTLERIVDEVEEADHSIQSITDVVDDQAAMTQEIESLVSEVGEISENTTANATDVAAAAQEQTSAVTEVTGRMEDLSQQATALQEMTDEFIIDAES